jgi:hypothetical protein
MPRSYDAASLTSAISDLDVEKQPLQQNGKKKYKRPKGYDTTSINTHMSSRIGRKDPPTPYYPRLVARDLPFEQSQSKVGIHNFESDNIPFFLPSSIKYVLSHNWFHRILRWPTLVSISFLVAIWFFLVVVFARIYVAVDSQKMDVNCGLGKAGHNIGFSAAFAFSLETCTTVGYGLPNDSNNFFEPECRAIQITITLQMIVSMLFNAFLTAFLWCRLARCDQRSSQVLFSNKAIIEKRDGKWLFHVRMYDVDSSLPIVEAHVRLYCVSWNDYDDQVKRSEQPQLMRAMRILEPNDDLGSVIFTSVPFNATHHIDFYSPLAPDHLKKGLNYIGGHGLMLREADQMSGSLAACTCPVCGEMFETFENLEQHIKFNKILEDADPNLPIKGTHRDEELLKPMLTKKFEITKKDIKENLRGKEIVCLVEGIEPLVSGTFQALHSYKFEDIEFDCCFAPCVAQINGKAVVDLDVFHKIIPGVKKPDLSKNESCSVSSASTYASTKRVIFPKRLVNEF